MSTRNLILTLSLLCLAACGQSDTASKEKVKPASDGVFFVNLKDGDTVKNPIHVKFDVRGMTVAKPGDAAGKKIGHHHLIIDGKPIPYGTMVPMDARHLHFMKGETEHTLSLDPGAHTLTLQFAGTDHRSFGKPMSKTISVKVTGEKPKDPHAGHGQNHAGMDHSKHTSASQMATPAGDRRVFFKAPLEGQVVPTSTSLIFATEGLIVTPAGQSIDDPKRGHHHVIIDGKPVPKGTVVPADEQHIHYGKGQTAARILLKEGPHTLTLQFADGAHRSYGPEFSHTIKVVAKPMHVFFKSPPDKSTLSQSGTILFGVSGATVTPAGQHINDTTRGHHHLIIDGGPLPRGEVVPANKTHIHFGKGQTEVKVESLGLKPGQHTLTLQFADGAHRSLGPEMSRTITVTISE